MWYLLSWWATLVVLVEQLIRLLYRFTFFLWRSDACVPIFFAAHSVYQLVPQDLPELLLTLCTISGQDYWLCPGSP